MRTRRSGLKYIIHKVNPTSFKKGMIPWNKGVKGYQSGDKHYNFGKKRTDEVKTKIRETKKKNVDILKMKNIGLKGLIKQQNMKQPTSIEKVVYDYLVLKGVVFEKQKLINGKFIVDAYIPSLNLIIEADGTYWHGLDRVKKKDKAENAYLKKCGFNLIRLQEDEILDKNFTHKLEFSLRGGD